MKQLKFLSMMMLVAVMSMMMGCSSDDDNEAQDGDLVKQAVGTWMCTSSTDSSMGRSVDGLMVGKQVTIKSDGTYTSTAPTFGYSGTYTINGNTITAKNSSGDTFVVNVSVSGDKMTWTGTASNGVTFKYVFVREG